MLLAVNLSRASHCIPDADTTVKLNRKSNNTNLKPCGYPTPISTLPSGKSHESGCQPHMMGVSHRRSHQKILTCCCPSGTWCRRCAHRWTETGARCPAPTSARTKRGTGSLAYCLSATAAAKTPCNGKKNGKSIFTPVPQRNDVWNPLHLLARVLTSRTPTPHTHTHTQLSLQCSFAARENWLGRSQKTDLKFLARF